MSRTPLPAPRTPPHRHCASCWTTATLHGAARQRGTTDDAHSDQRAFNIRLVVCPLTRLATVDDCAGASGRSCQGAAEHWIPVARLKPEAPHARHRTRCTKPPPPEADKCEARTRADDERGPSVSLAVLLPAILSALSLGSALTRAPQCCCCCAANRRRPSKGGSVWSSTSFCRHGSRRRQIPTRTRIIPGSALEQSLQGLGAASRQRPPAEGSPIGQRPLARLRAFRWAGRSGVYRAGWRSIRPRLRPHGTRFSTESSKHRAHLARRRFPSETCCRVLDHSPGITASGRHIGENSTRDKPRPRDSTLGLDTDRKDSPASPSLSRPLPGRAAPRPLLLAMALLDKVPGDLKLYIGGMFSLRRQDALRQANITHVLSVLRMPLDQNLFSPFKHMVVEVDDVEDENLLEHFPATNRFIQEGLDGGGGVLVHCAMGKSRSATCVVAYLMQKHNVNPTEALAQVRQARSIVEPNEGFMKQLELYGQMQTPPDVESTPAYQRWVYQREIELSRACGQAPEADKIRFEDEHVADRAANVELRCRKCRRPLATSQYLVSHSTTPMINGQNERNSSAHPSANCAHYFLDPLSWMRPELEQGKLDGRLECPKCHTNVGKYAWQGMQCSCSEWVVPGISLSKGRVDHVKKGALSEIRHPPGVTAPPPANASHSRQNL